MKDNKNLNFQENSTYVLIEGKFPLTDYKDMFSESQKYHKFIEKDKINESNYTLNKLKKIIEENSELKKEIIELKITGFNNSCEEGKLGIYGSCNITVEKRFNNNFNKKNSIISKPTQNPPANTSLVELQENTNNKKILNAKKNLPKNEYVRPSNPLFW